MIVSFRILSACIVIFMASCNLDKPKDKVEPSFILPFLSGNSENHGNENKPPETPDLILPNEIVSVSPNIDSTYSLDFQDAGFVDFGGSCFYDGEGIVGQPEPKLRRIVPTTKLVIEVKFLEKVTGGKISLRWLGAEVPGKLTYPDPKTARFESLDSAHTHKTLDYFVTASEFLTVGGNTVPPYNWNFHTNLSDPLDQDFKPTEACVLQNGNNQCTVQSRIKGSDGFQDFVKDEGAWFFYYHLGFRDDDFNYYGYGYIECDEKAFSEKEFKNEFWLLEMNVTFANIPEKPPLGEFTLESYMIAASDPFIINSIEQYDIFQRPLDGANLLSKSQTGTSKQAISNFFSNGSKFKKGIQKPSLKILGDNQSE
ncbi:hypothetical protein [Leptospira stimsonii]|uniref:Lipoprotein n=1 Tax=Leptospira stimsonii TaxID=2202203 RepID=A0ABY2MVQ5_9LEPT|nr:hypothetical protein [Leptospira stimsonii]TGK14501.1 hypothetical protein EHO98_16710 [Leptospira stimsonii]TGM09924.1 hypothetical protein EHQ90_19665 [Leptospira stimsonii]